jgi:hypothetical protein
MCLPYSIQAGLVFPGYALWETPCEIDAGLFLAGHCGEHQGRFEVIVAAYRTFFVTCIDKELLLWPVSTVFANRWAQ